MMLAECTTSSLRIEIVKYRSSVKPYKSQLGADPRVRGIADSGTKYLHRTENFARLSLPILMKFAG
jgi:hypothetical protein